MEVSFTRNMVTVTVKLYDATIFDIARDIVKDEGIDISDFSEDEINNY